MRRIILLLTIGIFFAQVGEGADKWLTVRSRNFFLVGNASEGAIKRVGRNLEEFRAAFTSLFPGISERDSVPTTVMVFRDDSSFRAYKPLYQGKPANVSGYFQQGPDVNFIALTGEVQTPHVIYHEYVHSLTRDGKSRLPLWASEGIAELYSTLETQSGGKQVLLGKIIEGHIATLNQYPLLSLETFFGVEHGSPFYNEGTKQGIFYAQSWALIHYLTFGAQNARQGQLSKYVTGLATGKSSDDSFREAFQTDYARMEEELRNYMQGRIAWPAVRFKLDDKLDIEQEMQVSPLSEARAQFHLGDLLLHTGRLEEAEAQIHKAITLEPEFPGNYASMGFLRVRQKNYNDALTFLSRGCG